MGIRRGYILARIFRSWPTVSPPQHTSTRRAHCKVKRLDFRGIGRSLPTGHKRWMSLSWRMTHPLEPENQLDSSPVISHCGQRAARQVAQSFDRLRHVGGVGRKVSQQRGAEFRKTKQQTRLHFFSEINIALLQIVGMSKYLFIVSINHFLTLYSFHWRFEEVTLLPSSWQAIRPPSVVKRGPLSTEARSVCFGDGKDDAMIPPPLNFPLGQRRKKKDGVKPIGRVASQSVSQ